MHNKEFKVKISNNLLQKNKYDLNIHTQKLIMLLIYKKKKELINDNEIYSFDGGSFDNSYIKEILSNIINEPIVLGLNELKKLFGNNRISFSQIVDEFINFSGSIQWIEDGKIIDIIPISKRIKPYWHAKEIEFRLNPEIEDYILSLENNWSEIDIDIYLNLTSKYKIRFYEYLCLYNCEKNNSNDHIRKRTLEDIRNFFGIPNSYEMKNITQKVFNPAIEALNNIYEKENKQVKIEYLKLNSDNPRKITHLRIDVENI